jgi:two-component system response regulator PhoP
MIRAGEVISKTELTDRLYDQDFERDSNVIEVFIGRLRKKMDPDNSLQATRPWLSLRTRA